MYTIPRVLACTLLAAVIALIFTDLPGFWLANRRF